MSYSAMCWAMGQPVHPAITKFVLVAMAECVNSEAGTMECWPSYAYLAKRTGASANTVEASVYRLREQRFIVDTGKRAGGTGKVLVYRLNDPANGVITQGPQGTNDGHDASATRAQTTPQMGPLADSEIPPNLSGNPPKSDGKSPQISRVTTPNMGSRTRNGIKKESGKESGIEAACAALPDVSRQVLSAWLPVRTAKRAGPVTEIVASALCREAAKAGLSAEEAVRYCCEAGWQNFTSSYYANRESSPKGVKPRGNAQEALEASNRSVADRFLANQEPTDAPH